MFSKFDYIALGTLGYAQVGTPHYDSRIIVERKVIDSFFKRPELEVPEQFEDIAHFRWIRCPHDFGSYWDFQISYERDTIEEYEEEEDDYEKFVEFWDWVHKCENAFSENEEILFELMDKLYQNEITMEVVHKNIDENKLLKIV